MRGVPDLYILAVFPSSSGMAISGAVDGYVTGICTETDAISDPHTQGPALSLYMSTGRCQEHPAAASPSPAPFALLSYQLTSSGQGCLPREGSFGGASRKGGSVAIKLEPLVARDACWPHLHPGPLSRRLLAGTSFPDSLLAPGWQHIPLFSLSPPVPGGCPCRERSQNLSG